MVVTSRSRRAGSVMACWQRNWQVTQPPAAARRRLTEVKVATATAAATAATVATTSTAVARAAVLRKWRAGTAKTSHATKIMATSRLAGRA